MAQIVCVIAYALRPCVGCHFSADDIRHTFKKTGRYFWPQNFTGRLRHFAAKLLSLPLLIPGGVEREEQSDLQKDLALVRTAVG